MKPLLSFAAISIFGLVLAEAACSSSTADTQTQCASQSYPNLACKTISSCATGQGVACTSTVLKLPDGRTFKCASCNDCAAAQSSAVAACNEGSGANEDAGTTDQDSGDEGT
jgi:hypothetical protein